MSFPIYLFIALCVAFSDQIYTVKGDEPKVTILENSVEFVTSNGLHLEFPFSPNCDNMDEQFRQHVLNDMSKTYEYLSLEIGNMLNKRGGESKLLSITKKLTSMVAQQSRRQKNTYEEYASGDVERNFFKEAATMFRRLMKMSNKDKVDGEIDTTEIKESIQELMNTLNNGFHDTSAPCFIDFSQGKVDGVPLNEYTSNMIDDL